MFLMRSLLPFLALPVLLSATPTCPSGSFLSVYGDKCFQVVELASTFQEAENVCVEFGGHLASVHDKWDNDALTVSDRMDKFWLGGRDQNNNDKWTWIDGSRFEYVYWAAGQPSKRSGKNCLIADAITGLWSASECSVKADFVCETSVRQNGSTTLAPTTTSSSSFHKPCPDGYTCDKNFGYYLVRDQMTWDNSENFCQQNNGHLASVHKDDEEGTVVAMTLNEEMESIWLGGVVNVEQNGQWNDNTPFNYTRWVPGAPDTAFVSTCIALQYSSEGPQIGWYNWDCQNTFAAICKVPLI
ncbi:hypothetical protein L596_016903 [Steinernema carpocapsae]|uniref:C-type lectin domain-containing protein n=1 Tax=Steinernema carpocapsae TaxID=34508 RepID=A0A4U5NKL2_STECR|nr:hypothetical protein L596_016903 [Steinernema carpocapsae]